MMAEECESAGIRICVEKSRGDFRTPKRKDRNAEGFWGNFADATLVCKTKSEHSNWGKRKIRKYLKSQQSTTVSESQIQRYCTDFLYDCEEEQLYFRWTEVNTCHRRCVTREELIKRIQEEHGRDHHRAETLYESLRCSYYPVVRESVISLYKQRVVCHAC